MRGVSWYEVYKQVFALVVTGMPNKLIAGELGIGEKTVKVHRGRVMKKMRAGSVAELVRLADCLRRDRWSSLEARTSSM